MIIIFIINIIVSMFRVVRVASYTSIVAIIAIIKVIVSIFRVVIAISTSLFRCSSSMYECSGWWWWPPTLASSWGCTVERLKEKPGKTNFTQKCYIKKKIKNERIWIIFLETKILVVRAAICDHWHLHTLRSLWPKKYPGSRYQSNFQNRLNLTKQVGRLWQSSQFV